MTATRPVELELHNEPLPMSAPFRIAGHVFEAMPATVVTLHDGLHVGRGEAAGVYYNDDHPEKMIATLEALRPRIEAGLDRETLRALLPAGGARNALDCALWELESQRSGVPVWKLAGLEKTTRLLTTFTVGADEPAVMADRAADYSQARALKLKLTGDLDLDAARVRAVRARCPRSGSASTATRVTPRPLCRCCCRHWWKRRSRCSSSRACAARKATSTVSNACSRSPPTKASSDLAELEQRHHRFDVVNIKLDKCGGLTEGLLMAAEARRARARASWSATWSAPAWPRRRPSCSASSATSSTSTGRSS